MAAEQNSTECQQILAHIQFGDAPYIVRVVDNNIFTCMIYNE